MRIVPRQQYINICLPISWHAQNFLRVFETFEPGFHSRCKQKSKHKHGVLISTWKRPLRRHTHQKASTSINFFPLVLVLALILAFAQQQAKTKYRSSITQVQGYLTTRGCVWSLKSLDPDFLAPEQFSKMPEDSNDFACTCVCVEFHFHLGHRYCLSLCLCACVCARVATENQALKFSLFHLFYGYTLFYKRSF